MAATILILNEVYFCHHKFVLNGVIAFPPYFVMSDGKAIESKSKMAAVAI